MDQAPARYFRSTETRKNIEFELPRPRVTYQNFKPRSKRTEMYRQQRKPWFEGHSSRRVSTDFKNFAPAARWKASGRHFALIFKENRPRGPRGAGWFADQALRRRTNVERQRTAVPPHGFAAIRPRRHANTVVRARRGSWSHVSMYRNVTVHRLYLYETSARYHLVEQPPASMTACSLAGNDLQAASTMPTNFRRTRSSFSSCATDC